MSTLAKVLVFLTLLLSLFVPTAILFLYAESTNWKGYYDKEHEVVGTLEGQVTNLQRDLKARTDEKDTAASELAKAEGALKTARADFDRQIKSLQDVKGTLETQLQAATTARDAALITVKDQTTQIEKLHTDLVAAQKARAEALDDFREKEKELAIAMDDIGKLTAQLAAANQEVESLRETVIRLTKYGPGALATGSEPVPIIKGEITAVGANGEIVVVNIGTSDGLKPGWRLMVYRGENEYVGEVQVREVQEQQASALKVLLKKGMSFRTGDRVVTK